ncbi:hypothetical protein [Vibrio gallicus]|uniref:hypothetical protein n=1 Tax=Vibrio gallicus TaxID=190897 RepID=UPI0021C3A01F|nr:hypothetical protein [Vibrio gallicus]
MLKHWLWDNRKDLSFVFLFWLILSYAYLYREWPQLASLQLGDNDNYMRFVQFTSWIEHGDWYLNPIPRFNPQDGMIIHWSRLPDIPLVALTLLLSIVLDQALAPIVASAILPLLYLLALIIIGFAYSEHYLDKEQRFVATLFIVLSPIANRFLPGAIDHHNLQLLFVVIFLLLSPITKLQFQQVWRGYTQALIITLSLWVGLENFILWVFYLACFSLHALWAQPHRLAHLQRLCLASFGLTLVALLINRPYHEFFTTRFDAISLPFALCFLCGGVLLGFANAYSSRSDRPWKKLILCALIAIPIFTPLVFTYPELIKGAYADYPEILKEYWLSNVSEARSLATLIKVYGIASVENYLLYFIPALCYPFIRNKSVALSLLYAILVLHLLVAFIWQIRAISLCFILSAPLQAYVIHQWFRAGKHPFLRALTLIFAAPSVTIILVGLLFPTPPSKIVNETSEPNNALLQQVFNQYQIHDQLILTGIETGSKILATSDNHIIAAPYHRNIAGNTHMIKAFLETDMTQSQLQLQQLSIDYILIGHDKQLDVIKRKASPDALLIRLQQGQLPQWLARVTPPSDNGYQLFQVKE